jgi:uncharacterized protein
MASGIKIDITHIPSQGCIETIECQKSQLFLDSEEILSNRPIQVILQLKRGIGYIQVKGEIKVNLKLNCSRCLEDFTKDFSYNLDLNFPVREDQLFLDITEDLRQEIILNRPFKILCRPDCKGLCPVCGSNLNKGVCSCGIT